MDAANRKPDAAPPLSAAAISALRHGRKIEAIRIVREERNIDLKGAKNVVDDYIQSQPALQSSLAAAQAGAKRSVLFWLVILIALALLAYDFFSTP